MDDRLSVLPRLQIVDHSTMTVSPQHAYLSLYLAGHLLGRSTRVLTCFICRLDAIWTTSSEQSTSRSSGMPCDTFQRCSVQHEKLCSRSKLPTSRTYTTRFSGITDVFHVLEALKITGVDIHKIEFLTTFSIAPLHDGIYNGCEHTMSTRVVVHIPDSTGGDVHTISHAENNRPWPTIEATPPPAPKSCAS